jgi:dihydrofolate reductase
MGRRTFESLGRVLSGERAHIVVTKDPRSLGRTSYKPHYIASSIEEGIDVGKKIEKARLLGQSVDSVKPGEVFIFGGGQIYKEAVEKKLVDRLYLTIVEGDFGADTFFSEYKEFGKVIFEEEHEEEGFKFQFLDLER